jgi:hypothetical protein
LVYCQLELLAGCSDFVQDALVRDKDEQLWALMRLAAWLRQVEWRRVKAGVPKNAGFASVIR